MRRDHKGQRPPRRAAADRTGGRPGEQRGRTKTRPAHRDGLERAAASDAGLARGDANGESKRKHERKPKREERGPASGPRLQRQPRPPEGGAPAETMRIAKAMARAGLCSRREAERWISEGRVSVNGRVLDTPALEVGPRDKIVVDGQPLPEAEGVRLWRYYKPRGLVTTHADPEGRPTVFDSLPPDLPRVISVGRLDFNTEGLLLLTNDGALARYMELPSTGWLRRYRVRARGRISQAELDRLKAGISIEGVNYGPVEATLDSAQGANVWLTVGLREGKNREIRNILGHLGLEVGRLIRVSFGPFQLLDLEPGEVERIRRRTLRDQLGLRIARDLGLIEGTAPRDAAKDTSRPRDKPRAQGWTPGTGDTPDDDAPDGGPGDEPVKP